VLLLLTRHGEAVSNRRGLSAVDSPLTDLGRQQAHLLGRWLATHETLTAFYASPLLRARQTAEIVNRFLRMEIVYLDDLREAEEHLVAYVPRHSDPLAPLSSSPPGRYYESFRAQVMAATRSIVAAQPAGKVLVVAHGGTLGTMLRSLLGTPAALLTTDNCAMHKLIWYPLDAEAQRGGHWNVQYLNRRVHLDGQG
jgi:uncharacterized phosphatase